MSDPFKMILGGLEKTAGNVDFSAFNDQIKIDMMNKKHAFINSLGGKPFILCHTYDETFEREMIEFRTSEAIRLQYANDCVYIPVMGGEKPVPLGKYWLEHKLRRGYETVVFNPSKPSEFAPNPLEPEKLVLNIWEGLSITPVKGSWKKTRRHVWKILCNKDPVKFKYFFRWFAWTMQNPDKRAEVAVIIKGKQGAGKGFFFSQFKEVFGPHYMNISSGDHLTGKFNEHLRRTVFLFADEAYDPKDREAEGKLKQLITEETIPIEAKFRDTVIAKNRLHIVMATNNDRVLIASEDTRRFFINETDNRWAKGQGKTDDQRVKYFAPLFKEMNDGGRAAMVYDLLNTKLGNWHPRNNIPETKEMSSQKRMHYSPLTAVLEYLDNGEFPGKKDGTNNYIVRAKELERHMRDTVPMLKDPIKISWVKISAVFDEMGVNARNRRKTRSKDGWNYKFPELKIMRRIWEYKHPDYVGHWDLKKRPMSMSEADIQQWRAEREWILTKDAF